MTDRVCWAGFLYTQLSVSSICASSVVLLACPICRFTQFRGSRFQQATLGPDGLAGFSTQPCMRPLASQQMHRSSQCKWLKADQMPSHLFPQTLLSWVYQAPNHACQWLHSALTLSSCSRTRPAMVALAMGPPAVKTFITTSSKAMPCVSEDAVQPQHTAHGLHMAQKGREGCSIHDQFAPGMQGRLRPKAVRLGRQTATPYCHWVIQAKHFSGVCSTQYSTCIKTGSCQYQLLRHLTNSPCVLPALPVLSGTAQRISCAHPWF